ncbi:MAG: TonB family protein [Alphaproteobacteria bacterium]
MPDICGPNGVWRQLPTWAAVTMDVRRKRVSAEDLVRGESDDPDYNMVAMPAAFRPELSDLFTQEEKDNVQAKVDAARIEKEATAATVQEIATKTSVKGSSVKNKKTPQPSEAAAESIIEEKPQKKTTSTNPPKADVKSSKTTTKPVTSFSYTPPKEPKKTPATSNNKVKKPPSPPTPKKPAAAKPPILKVPASKIAAQATPKSSPTAKAPPSAKASTAGNKKTKESKSKGRILWVLVILLTVIGYYYWSNQTTPPHIEPKVTTPAPVDTPQQDTVQNNVPVAPMRTKAMRSFSPDPVYPVDRMTSARRETVSLRYDITETGQTSRIRVTSNGTAALEQAAMQAMRKWRYSPATRNGVAIALTDQTHSFYLSPSQNDVRIIQSRNTRPSRDSNTQSYTPPRQSQSDSNTQNAERELRGRQSQERPELTGNPKTSENNTVIDNGASKKNIRKIVPAETLYKVEPKYPRRGQERGYESEIQLTYDIGINGRAQNIRVTDSGRYRNTFDDAAIDALKKFKFSPRTVDGRPTVEKNRTTNFTFKLD